MSVYKAHVSDVIIKRIELAEQVHNFTQASLPQKARISTDKQGIELALYTLAAEHHGGILHLLRAGMFDGSAFALVRPLIDAVYRALWLHYCGNTSHVLSILEGGSPYPNLPNMADAIEKAGNTGGLFTELKQSIPAFHGFTHGGIEQLGRRFDDEGNLRATYTDGEKLEAINATTTYLVLLAVAWCQIEADNYSEEEPRSAAIMECYFQTFC